jgi:hypothetical protein
MPKEFVVIRVIIYLAHKRGIIGHGNFNWNSATESGPYNRATKADSRCLEPAQYSGMLCVWSRQYMANRDGWNYQHASQSSRTDVRFSQRHSGQPISRFSGCPVKRWPAVHCAHLHELRPPSVSQFDLPRTRASGRTLSFCISIFTGRGLACQTIPSLSRRQVERLRGVLSASLKRPFQSLFNTRAGVSLCTL